VYSVHGLTSGPCCSFVDSIDLDLSLFGLRHIIIKGFSELFGLNLIGHRPTRALKFKVIKLALQTQ
jgi:hypothetical protein